MSGFAQLLGSTISESGDAFVLTPVEYMIGNPLLPALHGGAVASFLEVAAKRALARQLPHGHVPKLISVNLQFLASARPDALVTTPKVRRVGRRIAVVHADVNGGAKSGHGGGVKVGQRSRRDDDMERAPIGALSMSSRPFSPGYVGGISPVFGSADTVAWFCSALLAERRPADCLRR